MRSFAWKHIVVALVVCASPSIASAQSPAPADSSGQPARTNLLLLNPFGVVFNVINGEYEHVMSKSSSIGLAGTYYSPSHYTYATTEIKVRYYPSEHAPDGFSFALSGGMTHETDDLGCFDICRNSTANRPTLGFELDYNWLLGPARRFTVGTGIGAKRFFGNKDYGSIDGLPTLRVGVGVAF